MRIRTTARVKALSLLVLSLLLTVSCTVKECRDSCPCWLDIDLSGCTHISPGVSLKGWTQKKSVLGSVVREDDYGTPFVAEVPRGVVSYCACTQLEGCVQSGMTVLVPEGQESDRIYAYRQDVVTRGESAYDKVRLHKQYATVAVRFEEDNSGRTVRVHGGWSGLDLKTLNAVEGRFAPVPQKTEEGVWHFRMPRQGDDSIQMDITDASTGRTEVYDLGGHITRAGYDWEAEDLDDIMIGIDLATGEVLVTVLPWEKGQIYDEII